MSVLVFLNLLNELGKRDKMRGLPSILSLFRNEFNKFNNTRTRILDSIYHMTLRLLLKFHFCRKTLYFCHYVRNVVMDVITFPKNLLTTSGSSILLHVIISRVMIIFVLFRLLLFQKIFLGVPSECQTVWIQFRLDFQTVCYDKKSSLARQD